MRVVLAVLLLALPLVAFAPHAGASLCQPSERPTIASQDTPVGHVYVASYRDGTHAATGLWEETNMVPGLQEASDEACGAPADSLVAGACPAAGGSIPGFTILCLVNIE